MRVLVGSPVGHERYAAARGWLAERSRREPLLIVASTLEAGGRLCCDAVAEGGSVFGWQAESLGTLANKLAAGALAAEGLTPAFGVGLEALCARVVFELAARGELGRFAGVSDRPGLPRALARTLAELALACVPPDAAALDADLARVYARYRAALEEARLADPARVLEVAAQVARAGGDALTGLPTLLWDVRVAARAECELIAAVATRSPACFATVHRDDARTRRWLEQALGEPARELTIDPGRAEQSALYRLQQQLFAAPHFTGPLGDEVALLSAPGEGRECVEIARRALREAERGVRFDRMAILLRAPELYRVPLAEALRRARIPAHFTRGSVQPERGGRALLALLACADEELSARRFAEYLSLGVVPRTDAAAQALDATAVQPENFAEERAAALDEEQRREAEPVATSLPAPRRWERLLVEAAVLGGQARWRRRLDGLANELELRLASEGDADDARHAQLERELAMLHSLRAFALPLVTALSALPRQARWGEWLERLEALCRRAIAEPETVLATLRELTPLAPIGPVGLAEVRLVLERRLGEELVRERGAPEGKLLVAGIDEARGLGFDVVFVPGLAEKIFPKKLNEDPLLLDEARARLSPELETAPARIAGERAALQLAVSAARERVLLSFPRFAADRARPRVPSFYALEVRRAAEGKLPALDELAQHATAAADARMGWPAPRVARDAIDAAEYDLVVLHDFVHGARSDADAAGAAHYLLSCNPHLGRALRFRARRWHARWHKVDGLVLPDEAARTLIAAHAPRARGYTVTALERYAQCPYRFYLSAVVGLREQQTPEPIETLSSKQRGDLTHAALYALLTRLRADGLLPLTAEGLPPALAALDRALDEVAADFHERLAPAIERVWQDGIADIRTDLREFVRLAAQRPDWVPSHFELGFGTRARAGAQARGADPASREESVTLGAGLVLRGSIDLVERNGKALRAVDYKTGAAPAYYGAIAGGRALQPALYAQVLEQLFPEADVRAGEAYYCSAHGGWRRIEVRLDDRTRRATERFASTLTAAIEQGFLPAAPDKDACERCEFIAVCGPYEAQRVQNKDKKALEPLVQLRREP